MATKTTNVVFKQHDHQSVADLSGIAGALLLRLYGTFSRKTPIFGDTGNWLKKDPHRRFGGSKFVTDFRF